MRLNHNEQVFFALVKAGLWEQDALLSAFEKIDYSEVQRIAEEQSVVGLVTAGLEHVIDERVPKVNVLQFIGQALQLEQGNKSMNEYLAWLIERLRKENVYAILVKGQGIAQCYDRPLWRSCGDIDLLLSDTNYEKAKTILTSFAIDVDKEFKAFKHIGMTMPGGFVIELHGTLHCRLSRRVDRVIDEAQNDVFFKGNVRSEEFKGPDGSMAQVFLPAPDIDVIFVFTHILKHFYQGGIGLRQICDWCRLLWTYQNKLDLDLLESRLKKAGLMNEWHAFSALAVDSLGMPSEAIPFYSSDKKWSRKADTIKRFVMEVGNFGANRINSQSGKQSYIINKIIAFWQRTTDSFRHFFIFPTNSLKAWWTVLITGIKLV